jgi:hypothetical protein
VEPCASDDLDCVKRHLVDKILEVESLGRQLATSMEQTRTVTELVQVWKQAHADTLALIKPSPWYREPVLWFAIGATVAMVVTVALVYAIAPVFR